MKKKYYMVSILDEEYLNSFPCPCEVVTKTDTKYYGKNYIFREIITGQIIQPAYYDLSKIPTNIETGNLIYDNLNIKSCHKVSHKKVLKILKNISNNYKEYINKINDIENKVFKKILSK